MQEYILYDLRTLYSSASVCAWADEKHIIRLLLQMNYFFHYFLNAKEHMQ